MMTGLNSVILVTTLNINDLNKESANYGPPSIFGDKVLLEHNNNHLYYLCLLSHYNGRTN
jgi:hypothetical protein